MGGGCQGKLEKIQEWLPETTKKYSADRGKCAGSCLAYGGDDGKAERQGTGAEDDPVHDGAALSILRERDNFLHR